jgi:hypothetical protein
VKAETEFDEQSVIKSVLDSVYELSSSAGSLRR